MQISMQADWWRADRYEFGFAEERYVMPAADAVFQRYDPWGVGGPRQAPRPHLSFATLVRTLLQRPREGEDLLLEWIGEHGLLGLLPHRVAMVTLAPRLVPRPGRAPVESSVRYVRTGRGWIADIIGPSNLAGSEPAPESEVDPEWRAGGRRAPGVLLRGASDEWLDHPSWSLEPLTKTWGRYFPSIPESERAEYPYPSPASEAFWRIYAEPAGEIVRAARELLDILDDLGRKQRLDPLPFDVDGVLSGEHAWRSWDRLNALLEPTGLGATRNPDESIRQAWWSPSLLGLLGIMTLEDIAGGVLPRRCVTDKCMEMFVPTKESQKYHSKDCRTKQQKRNQRARQRERVVKE